MTVKSQSGVVLNENEKSWDMETLGWPEGARLTTDAASLTLVIGAIVQFDVRANTLFVDIRHDEKSLVRMRS